MGFTQFPIHKEIAYHFKSCENCLFLLQAAKLLGVKVKEIKEQAN